MHAQHIAVAGQAVDAAVFIRKHLHIGGAELLQHAELLQRVGHVSHQSLADQQLRIGKGRLENAGRSVPLGHGHIVAQAVGIVIRHQGDVGILPGHGGLVAFEQGLLRVGGGIRRPVAQGDGAGQIGIDDLIRKGEGDGCHHQTQRQKQ